MVMVFRDCMASNEMNKGVERSLSEAIWEYEPEKDPGGDIPGQAVVLKKKRIFESVVDALSTRASR